MTRQNVGEWRDDNEEDWKENASSSNVTGSFVHFLMSGCKWKGWWHGFVKGLQEGEWQKSK